jgi:cation-transporting P-type ATPase E
MSEISGLTAAQVKERLAKRQYNRASHTKTKTLGEILIENVLSVFNLIIALIIAFFIIFYLRTFDYRLLLDAIGIFMVAFVNTMIAIYQEIKGKRILDRVNLLIRKDITVVREGRHCVLAPQDIVLDEVIFLQRGDQAVVDGRVLKAHHLEIDESLLTGESVPLSKSPGGEIFSGSFCLSGNGYYLAEKVGDDCYASRVTRLAKKYKFILTPLQRRINFFVKALFAAAVVTVLLKIFLTRSSSLLEVDSIREMGTILESLVPQGLVLMSSVTFALGVYRISKVGAIVQRLNAVESFSNVQVTCMDKTGTLTENRLSVHQVVPLTADFSEDRIRNWLGTYARLSSEKNATIQALASLTNDADAAGATAVDEIPFNSERKMSLLKIREGETVTTLVLGAYDLLAERLPPRQRMEAARLFAANRLEVYRSLLLARLEDGDSWENGEAGSSMGALAPLMPLAIVSIADQVREGVLEGMRLFERQGIKFKILSGDAVPAILAVCREIGCEVAPGEVISGQELDLLAPERFAEVVRQKMIFGRLKPEHKLKIIKELQAQKIYTAMIGDGVNDLPAIKEANLGIAMEEGSAVTKEVADIILLKNKFSLLPKIFDEGNRVINTVGALAKLFLSKNFLIVYLGLLSILFLLEFPLTPRRVSLINIFAIGLPCMIIALKNNNVDPYKNFMLDLLTYVGIAAAVITVSGYLGFYLAQANPLIPHVEAETVMIAVMTMVTVANFLTVAIHKNEKERWQYLFYGLLLLGGYFLLLCLPGNQMFMKDLKLFYEIPRLQAQSWGLILPVGLGGSLLLVLVEKLRGRLLAAA